MGQLIQTFTFDRNTFLKTPELSADKAVESISLTKSGQSLDKTASNKVGAFASYMGLFIKDGDRYMPTDMAQVFLKLYKQDRNDSWRWLITRSFWLYYIPNGTNARANGDAAALKVEFNFFYTFMQLLTHLQSQKNNERFLYYDELCEVLNDDKNWVVQSHYLFEKVITVRSSLPQPNKKMGLLGELENQYSIPRDNFNGLFNKSYQQTGFFQYASGVHGKVIGIAIRPDLDKVLQERLRFVLDNPIKWDETQPWAEHLYLRAEDLPQKVSLSKPKPPQLFADFGLHRFCSFSDFCDDSFGLPDRRRNR